MYYYIYQITNLVNKKIYIGVHKSEHFEDGYMGSGKVIKAAIAKYGISSFRKDIIEFFQTYDEALEKEREIVDDAFLIREDVYNLRRGGTGGYDYINRNKLGYLTNNPQPGELNRFFGKKHSAKTKQLIAEKTRAHKTDIPLTEIHKHRISTALTGIPHRNTS